MLTEILKRCKDQNVNIKNLMSMYQRKWINTEQLEKALLKKLEA